jgi:hypothetical protein
MRSYIFPDLFEGAVQVVADGIAREVELCGDLVEGQALVAAESKHALLLRGQGGDGPGDEFGGFLEEDCLFGGLGRAFLEMAGQPFAVFLLPGAFLKGIEDMVAGRDENKIVKPFDGGQAGAFEPYFGEDVLDDLLGGLGKLGIMQGDAIEGIGIVFEEFGEGAFVTGGDEAEEFGFVVCGGGGQWVKIGNPDKDVKDGKEDRIGRTLFV